jgi:simple sugar transport system permease protein
MAVASDSPQSTPPSPAAAHRARRDAGLSGIKRFLTLREGSIIVVTIITLIYFGTSSSRFFTTENFQTLLPFFAPYAIMAAGQVFVMITGEIDLSIGGMYLFAPFLMQQFHHLGIGIYPSIIATLLGCMILGAFNGFAVGWVGISSFVTTLGMLFVLGGVTLVISHNTQITTPGTTILGGSTFENIFGGGTYSELIWAVGVVIILQLVLSFTRWGLYTVAVGGNRLGAAEAGVRTRLVLLRNFIMCAGLAALVGILEAVRTTSASPDPTAANDILFQAISAAVIGGTLLQGGSGTVVGAFIGALFLGILHDGLVIKGVNASYLNLYLGIAILVAMAINTYVQRVRTGSGRG